MATKTIKGFHDGSIVVKTAGNTYTIAENALLTADYVPSMSGPYGAIMEDMTGQVLPKNNTFNINGRIIGAQVALVLQGAGDVVNIGVTGELHSAYGIYVTGKGSHVTNAGEILSGAGPGIYGDADNLSFRNNGEINATLGMYADGNHSVLFNGVHGEIHALQAGIVISNTTGDKASITNHGLIVTTLTSGVGVVGSNGDETLVNDGTIKGNVDLGDGNNKIDDRGGKITGSIIGGSGDDVLTTDHASDVLHEDTSAGTDTVRSTVSYKLTENIEKLTLLGKANINGTGLDGTAETLTGNAGNNTLRGLGGADILFGGKGKDLLIGGADADTFHFSTGDGKDTVSDFVQTVDKIDLSGWADMTSLTAVKSHAVDQGTDLLISFGADSLLIKNIHEANLMDADFTYALV